MNPHYAVPNSDLAGYVGAYEYYIHDNATVWTEAVESCKQDGFVLAVVDTQDKLVELSNGLATTDNGIVMFVSRPLTKNITLTPTPSALATYPNTFTNEIHAVTVPPSNIVSTISEGGPNMATSKPSSSSNTISSKATSTVLKQSMVTSKPSSSSNSTSSKATSTVLKQSMVTSSSMNPETGIYTANTTPSKATSTVLKVEPHIATSKSPSSSITSGTYNELSAENLLLQLSRLIDSLNPQDPLSLKVATDAYGDFATSVQSINKPRFDVNLIESTQAIEEFAFKYASFNLNASKTEERKKNNHIVLQISLVPKVTQEILHLWKMTSQRGSPCHHICFQKQDTVVFNVLYRDLHEFADNLGSRNSKIDSMILGSDVRPSKQDSFTENVTIVLRTLEENDNKRRRDCVFWKWNFSHPANGSWSGDGCSLVESNRSHVVCTCNHLTNFAILMNIEQHKFSDKHKQALCYITYIGVGISLLGETITIVAYILLLCSSHDQQSHVHINLVATLAMAQVIFLAGIDATQDQVLCLTVAALIHYFYLSSFCWMLIEGVMLYLLIIEVYNTELKLPLCYGFSLGFPGLIVGATLIIAHLKDEGIHQYTASTWCWLSTEKHYIWSFAGPVILITAVNVVVFCIVVKEMVNMSSMQSNKLNRVRATVKACIVLFPLLGVTWLFGLLSLARSDVVSQYVFTILNSTQDGMNHDDSLDNIHKSILLLLKDRIVNNTCIGQYSPIKIGF
ncbi:hypothetical protein OS493_032432 [Desmophyllum pertusum]|uniref:Uncharacterized protein n=1 Tax=Desmophyllum pertusum TaxID=174260 RepID=A0A9W9ZXG4_9CNID|nr:hypothetical protein OS493_032432 [Desmophyllum pertusum]